jgi:Lysozyme like domain/LysM domain
MQPRHARPVPRRPLAFAAGIAVAAAVAIPIAAQAQPAAPGVRTGPAAGDARVLKVTAARQPAFRAAAVAAPSAVLVAAGDTLWGIAGKACGNPRDDLALAYNNGIRNPDAIYAGELVKIACQAAAQALAAAYPPPPPVVVPRPRPPVDAGDPPPAQQAEAVAASPQVTSASGYFSCSALEALWDSAGGNPGDAFMAAEIATAESGGNPDAISPTDDYGLFQINASHGPAMATLNPYGNAEAAVAISDNGQDWSAWTTYREGLETGRC